MVEHECAMRGGIQRVVEAEAFGKGSLRIIVARGPLQALRSQSRFGLQRLLPAEETMFWETFVVGKQVIQDHTEAEPEAVEPGAVVERHEEGKRPDTMRRDPEQDLALSQVLAHEAEIELFQIAQAAMNQARGAGGGPIPEILPLEQGDAQTAQSGIPRDPASDDAPADDDEIEGLARQLAKTPRLQNRPHPLAPSPTLRERGNAPSTGSLPCSSSASRCKRRRFGGVARAVPNRFGRGGACSGQGGGPPFPPRVHSLERSETARKRLAAHQRKTHGRVGSRIAASGADIVGGVAAPPLPGEIGMAAMQNVAVMQAALARL